MVEHYMVYGIDRLGLGLGLGLTPGTGRSCVVGEVTVAEISVPARPTHSSLLTRLGLTEVTLALTARHHGTYTGSGQANIYHI